MGIFSSFPFISLHGCIFFFFLLIIDDLICYRDHFRDGRGAGKHVGGSGADVSVMKTKPVCLVIIIVHLTSSSLCALSGVFAYDWLAKVNVGLEKEIPLFSRVGTESMHFSFFLFPFSQLSSSLLCS